MNVFESYAKYYDLLYEDKNYVAESNYLAKLIKKYAPNTKSIFEIGSGTGIHAIEMAKKGYSVRGIDFSNDMIFGAKERVKKLSEKLKKNLSFQPGDARSHRGEKKFDAVASLFHVISYMPTNSDLDAMLKTVSFHLKPGGLFIFDCWYGPAVLTDRPAVRVKEFENKQTKIIRIARPVMRPSQNIVDVNYEICIVDKLTSKVNSIKETHQMRYLFRPELEMMLSKHNIKIVKDEEWLTGADPGFNTWGVCYVGVKK